VTPREYPVAAIRILTQEQRQRYFENRVPGGAGMHPATWLDQLIELSDAFVEERPDRHRLECGIRSRPQTQPRATACSPIAGLGRSPSRFLAVCQRVICWPTSPRDLVGPAVKFQQQQT